MIFASWYFYLEFSLLSVTGCIWLYKMNESLGLYDPLFIIPLMQARCATLSSSPSHHHPSHHHPSHHHPLITTLS